MTRHVAVVLCIALGALLGACEEGDEDAPKVRKRGEEPPDARIDDMEMRISSLEEFVGLEGDPNPPPTRIRFLNKSDRKVKFGAAQSVVMTVRPTPGGVDEIYGDNEQSVTNGPLECAAVNTDTSFRLIDLDMPWSGYAWKIELKMFIERSTPGWEEMTVDAVTVNPAVGTEESFHEDIVIVMKNGPSPGEYTADCYYPYRDGAFEVKFKQKSKTTAVP